MPAIPTSQPFLTAAEILHVYGRNIDLAMARLDLSTVAVAREIGVSHDTLNRIRRAPRGRFLDPEILLRLAALFGCTADQLLNPMPGVNYPMLERLKTPVAGFNHGEAA